MSKATAREQVLRDYSVDQNGIIRSPGKFELEMIYTPYFYNLGLEGMADSDEDGVWGFNVSDEDRKQFPELAKVEHVEIRVCDQGFAYAKSIEA